MTRTETAGITRADEGLDGVAWTILGQVYMPKSLTEHLFSWHATFPPGTFVPPHVHPMQDEYLYILDGQFHFMLDGADAEARPGDLVRLPRGRPHGIFNRSGAPAACLFWVAPTRRLPDLFRAIDAMADQNPAEIVALSARHEVEFLPPPA